MEILYTLISCTKQEMIYYPENDPLNANGLHALSWDILSLYAANSSLEQAWKLLKKK